MTDKIELYPKSSCYSCEKNSLAPRDLPQSNLAYRGCRQPVFFDCYNKALLSEKVQPVNKSGYDELNDSVYKNKLAQGYGKVPCKIDGNQTWLSLDPRLYDPIRNEYLCLDRPPSTGDVKLKDIYNEKYTNYGITIKPYNQIDDGQIVYYTDRSIEDAFFSPVWSEPAINQASLDKDPMGSMKPDYTRKPILNTENPTVTTVESYPYCLSFIQDSQSHREDIMAYQQRKNNQSKWSARWSALDY